MPTFYGNSNLTPLDVALAELASEGLAVDIVGKGKTLVKFGVTLNADNGAKTTIAEFNGTEANETFATGNTVDSLSSDDAADDGKVFIVEGHRIVKGNKYFVVQPVTCEGTTPATLSTPLARATRVFTADGDEDNPATEAVGNVVVFDSAAGGSIVGGHPSNAPSVKVKITAGQQQSRKAATALSSTDVWIVTGIYATALRGGPSATVDVFVETRHPYGVWRPLARGVTLLTGSVPAQPRTFNPYRIVRPNRDVRMVAISSVNDTFVGGEIEGYLGRIV